MWQIYFRSSTTSSSTLLRSEFYLAISVQYFWIYDSNKKPSFFCFRSWSHHCSHCRAAPVPFMTNISWVNFLQRSKFFPSFRAVSSVLPLGKNILGIKIEGQLAQYQIKCFDSNNSLFQIKKAAENWLFLNFLVSPENLVSSNCQQ